MSLFSPNNYDSPRPSKEAELFAESLQSFPFPTREETSNLKALWNNFETAKKEVKEAELKLKKFVAAIRTENYKGSKAVENWFYFFQKDFVFVYNGHVLDQPVDSVSALVERFNPLDREDRDILRAFSIEVFQLKNDIPEPL